MPSGHILLAERTNAAIPTVLNQAPIESRAYEVRSDLERPPDVVGAGGWRKGDGDMAISS